ncbi:MAG: response regulator [Acidobacteria bacterium]|nr:response regulator [Acidobacteriota bacterium]
MALEQNPLDGHILMETTSDLDILIVDDDQPIRNLVRQIVHRLGYPARDAANGEEAIAQLENQLPDLLVLDLMMPKVSGWEVLEWLQERDHLPSLPVVVLTAVGSSKMKGLDDFDVQAVIAKPFEVSELMNKLRQILESRS